MNQRKWREWAISLPSMGWLVFFFVLPTLLVCSIAFRPRSINGGIGEGWTFGTWLDVLQPSYPLVVWRTLWLSAATTVICLLLAVPVAYWLARLSREARNWMLLLIILPFWTNFLIRVFAWWSLLHSEGWLKHTLVWMGVASPDTQLLYNEWAVLLVLVYTYIPFAILPLFASAEKFDFGLLDAARDLGAGKLRAFMSVFIPGISQGMITAFVVVFIPALGSYAIPEIVGGPQSEMIGNKIAQKVFVDRNLPHASALATLLALVVLLPVIYSIITQRKQKRTGGTKRQ
ncbi:MAG: ABC transporter permease [Opitutales bacterium]|jgi:spermidine/putrescine transport system permease protein